jgi:hypothetical protein
MSTSPDEIVPGNPLFRTDATIASSGERKFLFKPNHLPLHRPVKRQVNVRGWFQIGQYSKLGLKLRRYQEATTIAFSSPEE